MAEPRAAIDAQPSSRSESAIHPRRTRLYISAKVDRVLRTRWRNQELQSMRNHYRARRARSTLGARASTSQQRWIEFSELDGGTKSCNRCATIIALGERDPPSAHAPLHQQAMACRRQTPESISQSASRMRSTARVRAGPFSSVRRNASISRSAAACSRSASSCTLKYS